MFKDLNDDNFDLYAIKHYDNPQCKGKKEYEEDLQRIVYLKRLFRRYHKSQILKERLILNHIIILYNIFGIEAATRILFFKIDPDLHSILKTFLIYLYYIDPEKNYLEWHLDLTRIPLDSGIIKKLRSV